MTVMIEVEAEKLYDVLRAIAQLPRTGWSSEATNTLSDCVVALGISPSVKVEKYKKDLPVDLININGKEFAAFRVRHAIQELDTADGRAGCFVRLDDTDLAAWLVECLIVAVEQDHPLRYGQGPAFVEFCIAAGFEIDQTHS